MFPDLNEYAYKMKDIIPGTVLFSGDKNGLYIKAKDGIIEAVEVQAENSKKMNILEFLRGNNIQAGNMFDNTWFFYQNMLKYKCCKTNIPFT